MSKTSRNCNCCIQNYNAALGACIYIYITLSGTILVVFSIIKILSYTELGITERITVENRYVHHKLLTLKYF